MRFRAKLDLFVADNRTITTVTMVIKGFSSEFFRSSQELCVYALME